MTKFGAGGHCLPRALVNGRAVLNVHALGRGGSLTPGVVSRWQWPGLTAEVRAEAGRIVVTLDGGEAQAVPFVSMPGTRGGDYALWVCGCGQRRRHLYFSRGRFACRRCHRLDYASRHDSWSPALRRAAKLRKQLGGEPLPFGNTPPRPRRWPQWQRYDRMLPLLLAAEAAALAQLSALNEAADKRRKGSLK